MYVHVLLCVNRYYNGAIINICSQCGSQSKIFVDIIYPHIYVRTISILLQFVFPYCRTHTVNTCFTSWYVRDSLHIVRHHHRAVLSSSDPMDEPGMYVIVIIDHIIIGFLFTYVAPLVFVLSLTMIKDGYDDYCRYRRDKEANSQVQNCTTYTH
jgi:hypothetical protein